MIEKNNDEKIMNEEAMKDFDWKQHIRDVHGDMADSMEYLFPNNSTEAFLTAIWKMSIDVLEGIEVQVIVDDKNDLYISTDRAVFVSFEGHEDELTNGDSIRMPIKCWVHTHPSGQACFSETDWSTIQTWKPILNSAIVLGDNQYLAYNPETILAKKVYYGILEQEVI